MSLTSVISVWKFKHYVNYTKAYIATCIVKTLKMLYGRFVGVNALANSYINTNQQHAVSATVVRLQLHNMIFQFFEYILLQLQVGIAHISTK